MTSLDAGFLTCMHMRPKWLRDVLSPLLSIIYMFFPESADHKVRTFRNNATVEIMRCSWEKSTNPILRLFTTFDRGFLQIRKDITIPLPTVPSHSVFLNRPKPHINARLYFDGTPAQLAAATELIFQIPGGGFVTTTPTHHDDYVSSWARQVRVPIVSINYGKAPEFPYPWALEECYEAYRSIVESNGEVIGMSGWHVLDQAGRIISPKKSIKIVMTGDSAGANLATGVIFKCIEFNQEHAKPPAAFICVYPCLSYDMACWIPPRQLNLLRAESSTSLAPLIDSKLHIRKLAPLETSEAPRAIDVFNNQADRSLSWYHKLRPQIFAHKSTGPYIPSALSMTSRMSYFSDRIITPELLRGMALLYLSGSPVVPDLMHDHYLSPVIASDEILARFPKTYFIVGEKDPFVDDTVIFAARIREAKAKAKREWEKVREQRHRLGLNTTMSNGLSLADLRHSRRSVNGDSPNHHSELQRMNSIIEDAEFEHHVFSQGPDKMVKVKIIQGISHAFFQMMTFLPEARQAVRLTSEWFKDLFHDDDTDQSVGIAADDATELTDMLMHGMDEPNRLSQSNVPNDFAYYQLKGVAPGGASYQRIGSQWNNGSFPLSKPLDANQATLGDKTGAASVIVTNDQDESADKVTSKHLRKGSESGAVEHNNVTNSAGNSRTGSPLIYEQRISSTRTGNRKPVVMCEVSEKNVVSKRRSEMSAVLGTTAMTLPNPPQP
ncbi:hypothetical protein RTP6_000341 [Batrachochytrium dendrobatidis]